MDSDNVIYIEDELAELNISYLANEKFQEYLSCKESNSYYSDILQDLMEHMGNNKQQRQFRLNLYNRLKYRHQLHMY